MKDYSEKADSNLAGKLGFRQEETMPLSNQNSQLHTCGDGCLAFQERNRLEESACGILIRKYVWVLRWCCMPSKNMYWGADRIESIGQDRLGSILQYAGSSSY